jgi:polysaccharide deacetylase 2 family uncharacterized protein YibQ
VLALRKKPRKRGFSPPPAFPHSLPPPCGYAVGSDRAARNFPARILKVSLLAIGVLAIAGCGNKPLAKTEARTVTAEIVSAAQRSASRAATIKIEPQAEGSGRTIDRISVALGDDTELRDFRTALRRIADNHGLDLAESGGAVHQFNFYFHGDLTHSVDVTVRENKAASVRPQPHGTGPRLAIIIDDLGEDKKEAESALALHFPVTLSVLPNLPFSQETAAAAHRQQDEVMLHLPMQSQGEGEEGGRTKSEPGELRVGMAAGEIDRSIAQMLVTVPYAAGVNNHQGSRATADPALMTAVMQSLRRRNLFFIDSRTTADTVAYETAEKFGVPAASRKVFLDDQLSRRAIAAQLVAAAQDAERDGYAIAIGHPHPETIAVLAHDAPRLKKHGIRLVFASELAR